jgi:hypothetical protein
MCTAARPHDYDVLKAIIVLGGVDKCTLMWTCSVSKGWEVVMLGTGYSLLCEAGVLEANLRACCGELRPCLGRLRGAEGGRGQKKAMVGEGREVSRRFKDTYEVQLEHDMTRTLRGDFG